MEVFSIRFVTQKDSVVGAALFQATADALHLDGEPAIAQALLEFSILSGGPDGQHPAHLESRASGGESPVVVEPGVVRCGKRRRAVVHVEEHGIEPAGARTERDSDVTHLDPHSLILQRMSRERPERAPVPLHDGGQKLGDDNARVRRKKIERRAQREAHSEAADQHEGCSSVRARRQPNVASASSEPCIRLDIRLLPLARMMYSWSRRTSFMSVPSGVSVSPSNSKGFTSVISQERET